MFADSLTAATQRTTSIGAAAANDRPNAIERRNLAPRAKAIAGTANTIKLIADDARTAPLYPEWSLVPRRLESTGNSVDVNAVGTNNSSKRRRSAAEYRPTADNECVAIIRALHRKSTGPSIKLAMNVGTP